MLSTKSLYYYTLTIGVTILFIFLNGCDRAPKNIDSTSNVTVGWAEEFMPPDASKQIPDNWVIKGKPGTPLSDFSVDSDAGTSFLSVISNRSTGNIIYKISNIDLNSTPYLEWKWRVQKLPVNADARNPATDDQALGIYVGTGSMLSKKTVSYHWDTETPNGTKGLSKYGGGTVQVKWITLRNKTDPMDKWVVEKRNCAEDFKEAWGFIPENIYLCISSNSQYTKSEAIADLDWIKFTSSDGV